MKTLVFTYGTLKQGFINEGLLADQKFLGKAVITDPDYLLYEVEGRYKFPVLIRGQNGNGYHVYGELYEVSDKCLATLDVLEGVKYGLYERTNVRVATDSGEQFEAIAYLYLHDVSECRHVGQVWPSKELSRYRFANCILIEQDEDVVFNGIALWNKKISDWETAAFNSEKSLKNHCYPKRQKYGVPVGGMDPWSEKWFESRPREGSKNIRMKSIKCGEMVSPKFADHISLSQWAAEHLTFFGETKKEASDWLTVIRQMVVES